MSVFTGLSLSNNMFLQRDLQPMTNFRDPRMVDGELSYIKETQFPIEFLAEDAHNWTLLTPINIGSTEFDKLVPISSSVQFINVGDATRFQFDYQIVYGTQRIVGMPIPLARDLSLALGAELSTSFPISAKIQPLIIAIALSLLLPGGPSTNKALSFSFQWTPGFGDGMAKYLPSPERTVQQLYDSIVYFILQGQMSDAEQLAMKRDFRNIVKELIDAQLVDFMVLQYKD